MFNRILSLAKHTAVYGIGDLLGRAVGVLLVPLYARQLTLEDNGVISLAYAFIGFSAVFYSLGLNPALIRLLSGQDNPTNHRTPFSSVFWTLLGISVVLSGLVALFAKPLASSLLGNSHLSEIFYLIAAIVFFDTLSEPFFTLCRARQKSVTFATIRLLQYTFQIGLTIYLIAWLHQGSVSVFRANLASSGFAFLVMLPLACRTLRPTLRAQAVRDLLSFGIPFIPSTLSILIINLSDRFLVKFYLGLDALGIYGITYKLGLPMFFVVRAFRSAWVPSVLSISNPEEARSVCARVTTYFAVGTTFLFLILATYSREWILLIAGDNANHYLSGQAVVPLITLAYLLYGLYIILTAGVYTKKKTQMLPAIVGTGAAVNILVNLVLLPRIGLVAAAWSTLFAYATMVVLLHFSVRQFYPVGYEYGRLAKVGIAGGVVFLTLSPYLQDTTSEGIIARAIFLLGYPLLLWGWNFFDPKEWQALLKIVRRPQNASQTR